VETWTHWTPSQWIRLAYNIPGSPAAQQLFDAWQKIVFSVALLWPVDVNPPGIDGVATGVQWVPSQWMITGPAEYDPAACMPPTAQPSVGDNMKTDVRLASVDRVGLPLTTTVFHVPTPPETV